jgi:hypothetical protein
MAASEYLERKFGFPTRMIPNPVTDTVGAAAVEILRGNPDRVQWLIVNLSAFDGFVGFDPQVSATRGIFVSANGGNVGAVIDDDAHLLIHPVFAISPGGAGTWFIEEVERK